MTKLKCQTFNVTATESNLWLVKIGHFTAVLKTTTLGNLYPMSPPIPIAPQTLNCHLQCVSSV